MARAAGALALAAACTLAVHAETRTGLAATATAAPGAESVLALRDPSFPSQATVALRLAPLVPVARAKSAAALPDEGKRMRIGARRDVASELDAASGPAALQWIATPGGGRTTRLSLTSPGALALRLGLAIRGLPEGAQLRFVGAQAGARSVAAIDARSAAAAMREQGLFWTPLTEGDAQAVEIWVPEGADTSALRVVAEAASHLDTAPSQGFKAGSGTGAAASCQRDAACMTSSNDALARAARSVAKMIYTENGVTYLCSGTLVNDGSGSETPYLYTAAHCMQSQAAAATLNTFWFFESASCGGSQSSAYKQLSGGATLLHSNAATDAALVRLTDRAPAGAWFSGWDDAPLVSGTALVAIHHPAGDVKKASLGQALEPSATGTFATAAWTVGSTEGGSSGSGIFTQSGGEYVLRGGLRGGSASCVSSGDVANPSNRDLYSRLDHEAPTLRTWLAKSATATPALDATGLWWNPDESGWGLSIVHESSGHVFATLYAYDVQGNPTWLVMPEAQWRGTSAFQAAVYRTTGTALDRAYDASRFSATAVGSASIEFRSADEAVASLTIDGRTTVKTIRRFAV